MEANISLSKLLNSAVLQATTKCDKDFACLSDVKECLCEVKCAGQHHFVEIKPQASEDCRYYLTYHNSAYCLCPTRNEIYKRYGV